MRWSALQPLLVAEGIGDLLTLMDAASPAGRKAAAHCRRLLAQPRERLDPPPLLTGDDLAGPRDPLRPAIQDACCSESAPPSWTGKYAPRRRRWRWWRSGWLVVSDW